MLFRFFPISSRWCLATSLPVAASRWCSSGAPGQQLLLDGSPWQQFLPYSYSPRCCQHLCHSAASLQTLRHGAPASQHLCHCGALASNIFPIALRCSAPASNKPHPAEKSTPVRLAIWRIWAGFANSQHRNAAFATPDNICAHSSLLQTLSSCSDIANLSAHLHRLPTPPPYLRQMRLLHGRGAGVGWQMLLLVVQGAGVGWQMLQLVVRGAVPANHRAHESLF